MLQERLDDEQPLREIKLTDQEVEDLTNGLDCLRQVYAEPAFTVRCWINTVQEQRALIGRGRCT